MLTILNIRKHPQRDNSFTEERVHLCIAPSGKGGETERRGERSEESEQGSEHDQDDEHSCATVVPPTWVLDPSQHLERLLRTISQHPNNIQ